MVPLSSFVRVAQTTGPEYTVRFNLYRSVEILGVPAAGYSSGQALNALEDVAKKTLPAEMGYAWNALSYQEKLSAGSSIKRARAIARLRLSDSCRSL
jgi:HAE1 family hydrophobic/amphiphilic exporter-1